jgi:hypothetical protein
MHLPLTTSKGGNDIERATTYLKLVFRTSNLPVLSCGGVGAASVVSTGTSQSSSR